MRKFLARVLPWVVTAAILAFLFHRIPLEKVLAAAGSAASWFAPAIAATLVLLYLGDALAIWKTFSWFVTPMKYVETVTLRGATYLLAVLNYSLGQGAFVYFLNRTRGVRVMRAAAAVLLVMGINLLLLLLLASLALVLGAASIPELRVVILVGYAGLAVYVVLLLWRPSFLTRQPVLDVLLEAGVRGHLKALAVRLPHVMILLLMYHLTLHAFHVTVPVLATLLAMPVVLLLAVLPISFQGLGPSQGVLVFFFARFAQGDATAREAQVLAAGLVLQACGWLFQILVGVICMRTELGRSLRQQAKEIPSAA